MLCASSADDGDAIDRLPKNVRAMKDERDVLARDGLAPSFKLVRVGSGDIPAYKTFGIGKAEAGVAKVLAYQKQGISETCSYLVRDAGFLHRDLDVHSATYVVDCYRRYLPGSRFSTVVLGSAHRLGVYTAILCGGAFFPLQFLCLTKDWDAMALTDSAVAGFDYGLRDRMSEYIFVWKKLADLPPSYKEAIEEARNVLLVRSTETSPAVRFGNAYLHQSVIDKIERQRTGSLSELDKLTPPVPGQADLGEPTSIPDWEWGLPDEAVRNIQELCESKRKNFYLLQGSTVICIWAL